MKVPEIVVEFVVVVEVLVEIVVVVEVLVVMVGGVIVVVIVPFWHCNIISKPCPVTDVSELNLTIPLQIVQNNYYDLI